MDRAYNIAAIMVDVDSWQTQLEFYGYQNQFYKNDVYQNALPRLVDLFEKFNIKATFFIVGKHAKISSNRIMLKRLSNLGHEVANHSMTHPQRFSSLRRSEKEKEIRETTFLLEDIIQKNVSGFRAPNYDIDEVTLELLIKYNYKYDSSVFPTFLSFFAKITHAVLSGFKKSSVMGKAGIMFSPTLPYRPNLNCLYTKGDAPILEIPLCVTPVFRLPFYGTAVMAAGKRYFDTTFFMLKKRSFINYTFHAFEMSDKDRDIIDKRLFCHPGIKRDFFEKKLLCEKVLSDISEHFCIKTLEQYVEELDL